ncbi:MAG: hypothetical protein ACO1SV_24465 [Fimbriimonas sp.]
MSGMVSLVLWLLFALAIVWPTPAGLGSTPGVLAMEFSAPDLHPTDLELPLESGVPGGGHEGETDPSFELDHHPAPWRAPASLHALRSVDPHPESLPSPGHFVPLTPPPDRG